MSDVRIKTNGHNFHLRVAGIIKEDDKYLIMQIEGSSYYMIPGGHVELGENSKEAIIREIKEEVGVDIDIESLKLFCYQENFYTKNNIREHWIENYYIVKIKEKLEINNWSIEENDKGVLKTLHFKWVTLEELKEIDLRPVTIKNLLIDEKTNSFNHIINIQD